MLTVHSSMCCFQIAILHKVFRYLRSAIKRYGHGLDPCVMTLSSCLDYCNGSAVLALHKHTFAQGTSTLSRLVTGSQPQAVRPSCAAASKQPPSGAKTMLRTPAQQMLPHFTRHTVSNVEPRSSWNPLSLMTEASAGRVCQHLQQHVSILACCARFF